MAEEEAPVAERIEVTAVTEFACYAQAGEQACWATASLKAPFYEPTARAPVDIVAVIDKSGSMCGGKLDLVKKTLLFVIDQCEYAPYSMYFMSMYMYLCINSTQPCSVHGNC